MGNAVNKMADDLLGMNPPAIPTAPQIVSAPEVRKDTQDLPNAEAVRASKERLEQEKLRKGRKSLRQDLSVSTSSVGAGVAIPK